MKDPVIFCGQMLPTQNCDLYLFWTWINLFNESFNKKVYFIYANVMIYILESYINILNQQNQTKILKMLKFWTLCIARLV